MEQLTASLMSVGIGAASGLKPYFTVFALGLFGLLVPADAPSFLAVADSHIPATIANPWVLAVCAVLAVIDFVLDKSWLSGAPLELVNQFVRPAAGALLGMQLGMDQGPTTAALTTALGLGAALPVSLGTGATTFATSVALPGVPGVQAVRSLANDAGAVVLVLAAVLAPVVAAILGVVAIVAGIALFVAFRRVWAKAVSRFRAYRERQAHMRSVREDQRVAGRRVPIGDALREAAAQ